MGLDPEQYHTLSKKKENEPMSRNEKQEPTNQAVEVEDLTVNQERAAEINGGSYRTNSGRITSVTADPSDPLG